MERKDYGCAVQRETSVPIESPSSLLKSVASLVPNEILQVVIMKNCQTHTKVEGI